MVNAALKSPVRFIAAALCTVVAAAYVPITADHLHQAPYLGVLFLALAVGALLEAALLVRTDSRRLWMTVLGTGGASVLAYVWTRSIGLPGNNDDIGRWTEPVGVVSVTAASAAVLLSMVALTAPQGRRTAPPRFSLTQLVVAAVVVLLGLGWTGVAAAGTNTSTTSSADMSNMDMSNTATSTGGTQSTGYWNQVGGGAFNSDGVTRVYYISADVVTWNYAPTGSNQITGQPFDGVADTYVKTGPGRIGSSYLKCLYRQYSDSSFKKTTNRPPSEQYLGLLGPVIRAEVGDTIRVVYRNTCPFGTSVHPHGVLYAKNSEGAPYNDGTSGTDKFDDAVPTGGFHTYVWQVPERAGPGPHDGSSVMWMYHSHTDEVGDTYAGLMGPMVVTARGMARPDGSPKDVDTERFAMFSVMNENKSPLLEVNAHKFESPFQPVDPADDEFNESNLMHSVNGYVFGNQPMITMKRGQRVRWYVMSMGTEVDLHTPHWHGNDVVVGGMRMDVVSLLPATMIVADMVPDNPGIWLFHCHVNDHIAAGMLTRYAVT